MANPLTRLFLDPVSSDRERAARKFQLSADFRWWAVPLGIGVACLALSLLGLGGDSQRFWYAYLVAWMFCVSISVGALFFVMIHHIVKARWNVTLRRIPELLAANFPILFLLGLPILAFGMHDLFHWTHADLYDPSSDHYDAILAGKQSFLNTPFFIVRVVLYFAVWSYLGLRTYGLSVRQDTEPSVENTLKLRKVSAWGIPLCAVATAFASYDFLMSLDPHWFSTIFGVYFFAGSWLAVLSVVALIGLTLRRSGLLGLEITTEHYQDVGKYMFGFTVFWTYIAFSQYMLIWYGNLPEEIQWFADRYTNGWQTVTWALIIGHFLVPFFLLLPKVTKRTLPFLGFMCVWILVMHWVDLFWLAMPTITGDAAHAVATHVADGGHAVATSMNDVVDLVDVSSSQPAGLRMVDFATWFGMLGIFLGATFWRAGRHSLTPYNDPYFTESLHFENV